MTRPRVEIKICGLTTRDDAAAALEAGADYVGFVFWARSPRAVAPGAVARIVAVLGAEAKAVGVFVNASPKEVVRIVGDCGLHAAQIHGDERAEAFAGIGCRVWRAVRRIRGRWQPAPGRWRAERYVVDAAVEGRYGGSGVLADWPAAAQLAGRRPVMLAGGLTPDNVAPAVRMVRPLGVDVSSGVESAPGRKDYREMKRFIRAARSALQGQSG
jgi:phosphoribosylanthranilate isomerase